MRHSNHLYLFWKLLVLLLVVVTVTPGTTLAAVEETFDVLEIGTATYRNVTVTTKGKNYIFIMHSTGMKNVKLAELSSELRHKLGYSDPPPKVNPTAALSNLAKQSISKLGFPDVKQLGDKWHARGPASLATITLTPNLILAVASGLAFLYLLVSYCGKLICQKSGKPATAMIWIPVAQMIPLLRAANMSPAWLLAFFVPVINLVAQILWSFKIAQARGKSALVGLFLVLPITNIFAFLYLAFSDSPPKKEERVVEIMTLEAA